MTPRYLFCGVAVADLGSALAWYERLLGRPPDVVPNDQEAMWQVTDTGWIYVVSDADRAGKALVTVMVDDLGEELGSIEERGISSGPVETAPGLYRKAIIEDPEGNVIQLGQDLSAGRGKTGA
jgi:predicted enzyme related to lactoylglutathione lyase